MANSSSAIHAAQHHSEGATMVIVRVPKEDEVALTTALDAGASGIIIPHCESREEVEEFMKKIYYRMYFQARKERFEFIPYRLHYL